MIINYLDSTTMEQIKQLKKRKNHHLKTYLIYYIYLMIVVNRYTARVFFILENSKKNKV